MAYATQDRYELCSRFSYQIGRDYIYSVHLQLFKLTENFTLKDWRTIRGEVYWGYMNSIGKDDKGKKEYLLQCVKDYLYKKGR